MGFSNLSNPESEDEAGKTYALFIGDIVLVNEVSHFIEGGGDELL